MIKIKKEEIGDKVRLLLNNGIFELFLNKNSFDEKFFYENLFENKYEVRSLLTGRKVIFIKDNLPLLGTQYFGFRDWPSNVLELRPITGCMNMCPFCSVREGPKEKYWKVDYYVDREYILEWARYIIKEKNLKNPNFYINPQGEPILYDELPELIQSLSDYGIVGINTTLAGVDTEYVNDLIDSGLSYINISLHSLDPLKAKALTGNPNYDVKKVVEIINDINDRVEITLTPVIYKYNINDLEDLVKFALKIKNKWRARIVPQVYMMYKHGRKLPYGMRVSLEEFENILRYLEKKYNVSLLSIDLESVGIIPWKTLRSPIKNGEKFKIKFKLPGRRPNEYLTGYKNRTVSVYSKYEDFEIAKIISTKGNIFIAKAIY